MKVLALTTCRMFQVKVISGTDSSQLNGCRNHEMCYQFSDYDKQIVFGIEAVAMKPSR